MVEITINEDQTLTVRWTGRKGTGSLYQIMAEGNAKNLNTLTVEECIACYYASKACPFPMGKGEEVYKMTLESVLSGKYAADVLPKIREKLGQFRKELVQECGSSCNGPLDSYITIAAELKAPKEETPA